MPDPKAASVEQQRAQKGSPDQLGELPSILNEVHLQHLPNTFVVSLSGGASLPGKLFEKWQCAGDNRLMNPDQGRPESLYDNIRQVWYNFADCRIGHVPDRVNPA